ncbi:hypothetical protein DICPUDRAFT_148385 [Dictyostelium purpureum]|uniref:Carboxylic ester hydrolase n=1 Tax=Dictyostelium purpureum TaxID=5786 RepID=F0ZAZ8_DICPU|nr:uncharacterized protein DICPUDRAFT_148385 [Dictyostelium purpureum]EGC38917.1 hypothetical protein DICPUDRAFT_148385 [Dictyostelium purpureum]|eukprot:XP_003284597.1 hypothetical protein DICPUDRAFT_148385 [Dictyostelium purpureum]
MTKILLIGLFFLFLNIVLAKSKSRGNESIVHTEFGSIQGIVHDTNRVFYGIPFAQPPTGELRWRDPVDPMPWPNIRDATKQTPECAQICNLGPEACLYIGVSEDCLYLDVFAPKDSNPNTKYPVVVFIPGGAFSFVWFLGSGSFPIYDGTKLSQSNVILVNINYRLGTFGFLGTDLLHGNFGFLDQVKALEWVNKNIGAFGGNKNMVTLWGESAGAFSVATHLTSKYSRPYFNAAISFSSPLTVGLKDKVSAKKFAQIFSQNISCNIDDLDCLRNKTMDQVLNAQVSVAYTLLDPLDTFTIWSPVIDGDIIPTQPLVAARDGEAYDVPLIIGSVKDEAVPFVYAFSRKVLKSEEYKYLIRGVFPSQYLNILSIYPAGPTEQDNRPILSQLLTDYLFRCQDRYYLNRIVANHKSPVYHYQYVHIKPNGDTLEHCDGKVCHGSELSIFFNSYNLTRENLNQDERELGIHLNSYIVNFATNHNPNKGLFIPVEWTQVTKTRNSTLIIDINSTIRDITTNDSKCDAIDKTFYRNQI